MLVLVVAAAVAVVPVTLFVALGAALVVVKVTSGTHGLTEVTALVSATLEGMAKIAAAIRRAPPVPRAAGGPACPLPCADCPTTRRRRPRRSRSRRRRSRRRQPPPASAASARRRRWPARRARGARNHSAEPGARPGRVISREC